MTSPSFRWQTAPRRAALYAGLHADWQADAAERRTKEQLLSGLRSVGMESLRSADEAEMTADRELGLALPGKKRERLRCRKRLAHEQRRPRHCHHAR